MKKSHSEEWLFVVCWLGLPQAYYQIVVGAMRFGLLHPMLSTQM